MMSKFEIYKEVVKIGEDEYVLLPLTGKYLPLIYSIIKAINPEGKETVDNENILKELDDEVVKNIHLVVLETLKTSYPELNNDEDIKKLEFFASRNLWSLFNTVLKINMNVKE